MYKLVSYISSAVCERVERASANGNATVDVVVGVKKIKEKCQC